MGNQGYIKLHRKLLDWEWYDDFPTFRLFTHLLLKVNYEDKKWRGITVKRGSCITSYEILHCETGLTVKQIRRALDNLIKTGEAAKVSTNENTVITVLNYDMYQDKGKPEGSQKEERKEFSTASDGQTQGKQRATTKEVKNKKKDKKYIYRDTIEGFTDNEELRIALYDFTDMRFKMGVFTLRALEIVLVKLGKLAEDDESKINLVNTAIEKGWKTFFPPKENAPIKEKGVPSWWSEQDKPDDKTVNDDELEKLMKGLEQK